MDWLPSSFSRASLLVWKPLIANLDFLIDLLIIGSWIKYFLFTCGHVLIGLCMYLAQIYWKKDRNVESAFFNSMDFLRKICPLTIFFVFIFALFEMHEKNLFKKDYSSKKNSSFYFEYINENPHASIVITTDGKIKFYNDKFKEMTTQRLNKSKIPTSVYEIIE